MSENPYSAPRKSSIPANAPDPNSSRPSVHQLLKVARYQKAVLMAVLVQIVLYIAVSFVPLDLRLPMQIALLLTGISSVIFVYLLAKELYSTSTAVLMTIGALF